MVHCQLSIFYKFKGIKYKATKSHYDTALRNRTELDVQRKSFAHLLANVILVNRPLIYLDESSMNNWQLQNKAWCSTNKAIKISRADTRFSTTLYAAISSNALNSPVYLKVRKTTNQIDYRRFVIKIAGSLKPGLINMKPFLLFDGHSSHLTKATSIVINRYFIPLRQVPHSCQFNVVESLFAKVKDNLMRLLTLDSMTREGNTRMDHDQFDAIIDRALYMVGNNSIKGIMKSNRKAIATHLQM